MDLRRSTYFRTLPFDIVQYSQVLSSERTYVCWKYFSKIKANNFLTYVYVRALTFILPCYEMALPDLASAGVGTKRK